MLIFVEGANCRCLHFCFLVVIALNLFLGQVPCTWTEFEIVALQCDEIWSRKVNQDSLDLKVIVFKSYSVEQIFRSMIQLRLQTQNDELKSTLPLLFCKYQALGVTIGSRED